MEWAFRSHNAYADPPNDVELDVVFAREGGGQWRVPAFWAGGQEWRVRFTPPEPGTYRYHLDSTDRGNADLNGREGVLHVKTCGGGNPLWRRGPLQVSKDHRHFVHADGTPFFWLGDTWWKGLCGRITDDEFAWLAADRHAKGFNVVQIVAGLYPDEPPFDVRGNNAGGWVWEKDYARINPAYFDAADRRIRCLLDHEIVPCIVGCWGYYLPWMGLEKMKRHWRYLVARWGALPVVWCLAGEVAMPYYLSGKGDEDRRLQQTGWTEIAGYVRAIDPCRHPLTTHPSRSGREELLDDRALDFDMLQTGHQGWEVAANTVTCVSWHYSKTPPMPVVEGEVVYEGHMAGNWPDVQRFMFWSCVLNGVAGYTYGAGGLWQMNGPAQPHGPSPHGGTYENTPWNVAAQLPGARQLGLGKAFLARYPWWEMAPHPEWIEPKGPIFLEPHSGWGSPMAKGTPAAGDWLLPYAAGIPGKLRLIYIPRRYYQWAAPLVRDLEPDVRYRAFFFDPITGGRRELGELPPGARHWQAPRVPLCQDWVLVLERCR
jgi:hypothetical protein